MQNFSTKPLYEIKKELEEIVKTKNPKDTVEFKIINPDTTNSCYNGTLVRLKNNKEYIYRSYKTWLDLAHILGCKMLTPIVIDDDFIQMRYEKLAEDSFHTTQSDVEEKYGKKSIFSKIHKNEEAGYLHYFTQALQNVKLSQRKRILNLGVNSGDEFMLIKSMVEHFDSFEIVGIDYCQSAIEEAKEHFKDDENVTFLCADINNLNELDLNKFDLIISIGTLQSSNLQYNKLLMSIVQNQLSRQGAMILGWPNCRWIDGEMVYGAKMKNYSFSELSNLYKDVNFAKKYLQQKRFRVTITGKDYIFITATSINH
jgi:2-polyprenyl-3-methyl-5-hydroxy-6-metoxy-1,4-benzoquinol methylase